MNHFCTFHQEHHSKKSCPQWINSMTLVMNHLLDAQLKDLEEEEYQTNEPEETNEETIMVLWDWAPTLGLNEDEQNEEVQVSSVNVTNRSKWLVEDQSLVFPKTNKIKETMKKIISTTQTQHKVNSENMKETISVINKPMKTMVNKTEITKRV